MDPPEPIRILIALLDFDAPGRGLRAVTEIVARVPGVLCIVLTSRVEEEEFLAAMRAGASGYLPDGLDPSRLPFVVAGVMRGEAAVPRHFVARLIDELRARARTRRNLTLSPELSVELTSREWEAVELLRQGLPTREIATQLGISQVTVRRLEQLERGGTRRHPELGVGGAQVPAHRDLRDAELRRDLARR